jgi:hypothetical protein
MNWLSKPLYAVLVALCALGLHMYADVGLECALGFCQGVIPVL